MVKLPRRQANVLPCGKLRNLHRCLDGKVPLDYVRFMKLRSWLDKNDKSIAWLAREAGLSIPYVWRLIPRDGNPPERTPSLKAATAIAKVTNGDVTANDFTDWEPPKKRPRPKRAAAQAAA